jgi:uncharacterized protein YjdB
MKKAVKFSTTMFVITMLITSCKSDDTVAVGSVSVDHVSLSLIPGEQVTLVATVSPDDADDKSVTWSSNNTDVATVDASTGVVTAVSAGTATITVTTIDGGKTAVCEITVSDDDEEGGEEPES